MRSYVGLVRDHSASMRVHRDSALKDYNDNLRTLQSSAKVSSVDTFASVVECGVGFGADVRLAQRRENVLSLGKLSSYDADGNRTPLWDGVDLAIEDLLSAGDAEAVYLVMVTTDGLENASWTSGRSLRSRIRSLQATDRWSFTFRVPRGYSRALVSALDIAEGNVLEWDQTELGFEQATFRQGVAISSYYEGLAKGQTSTTRFYANLDQLRPVELERRLHDISDVVAIWTVVQGRPAIKDFCEQRLNGPYVRGLAYYQLVKSELVQDRKEILIRDRESGAIYSGSAARDLLKLPRYGSVRLMPGRYAKYELYVQSTSTNRILPTGTKVIYFKPERLV